MGKATAYRDELKEQNKPLGSAHIPTGYCATLAGCGMHCYGKTGLILCLSLGCIFTDMAKTVTIRKVKK